MFERYVLCKQKIPLNIMHSDNMTSTSIVIKICEDFRLNGLYHDENKCDRPLKP